MSVAEIRAKDEQRDQTWKQDQDPLTSERHCRVTDGDRIGYRSVSWERGFPKLYGPVYSDVTEEEVIG